MEKSKESHCSQCGHELPGDAPQGSPCPHCRSESTIDGPVPTKNQVSFLIPAVLPENIGPYKILECLGEGGMGVVYLAEQELPIRRKVALKVIKLGMDTQEVIARFESERQALAMMNHPNIARVHDAGTTERGTPYFVMEHVPGLPIMAYCDKHRLSTRERIELFIPVCQAIQHAHQKGIIHRDIKPSNVLVMVQDGKPVPKIIDFGVAKATNQRLTEKTLFTRQGLLIGTPEYMSPEQAEMTGLDVDTTTDIYSLGVLLYQLLVGALPFDAQALRRAGYEEIRRIIREQEPPKPTTRLSSLGQSAKEIAEQRRTDITALAKELRGDLEWITLKAMEKDRTRRYASCSELAADIERHLRNEPVTACPPNTAYRMKKFVRRHRLAFNAAALVFAAIAIGFGMSLLSLRKANREAERSRQVTQFLQDMLKSVGPSVALGRDTTMLREILDKTSQRLDKELNGQPEVDADLRMTIGAVYFDIGQYTNAEAMFREAVALRRNLPRKEQPALASALNNLTVALWQQGKLPEAEVLGREVVALRKKLLGHEHTDVASSLNNLAGLLRDEGKLVEAEALHREALAMQRKSLGNEHPFVGLSLYNLARVLYAQGNFAQAEAMCREASAIQKKVRGEHHPEVARSINLLANLLREQGKFAEAEALHSETLAMQRKLLGSEHPDIAGSLYNIGILLMAEGKFGEAESRFREALAMLRKLLGPEHPSVASSMVNLGITLQEEGKAVEAEKLQRQALSLRIKLLGSEHLDVAQSHYNLARVLRDEGKFTDSETQQREALEIRTKLAGEDPAVAESMADLARTFLKEKRFTDAETMARKCLTFRNQHLPDDWETFEAQTLLGRSLLGQMKPDQAEPLLLSGCQGMKDRADKIPAWERRRLQDALKSLIQYYQSAGNPDEAAKWKKELPSESN